MDHATDRTYGGNRVRSFGSMPARTVTLADDPYHYSVVVFSGPGGIARFDRLATGALWVVSGAVHARHPVSESELKADQAFLFDGPGLRVESAGPAVCLLSGTSAPSGKADGATVLGINGLHCVEKPWGEELWINGRHPTFAFKRIKINAGHRTSLQYHELKRETNLLLAGRARLHYNTEAGRHDGPFFAEPIEAVSVVDVDPLVLHRIEAVSDITLFEVSTPHLDDVIRVNDDTNREDGLIPGEHVGVKRS